MRKKIDRSILWAFVFSIGIWLISYFIFTNSYHISIIRRGVFAVPVTGICNIALYDKQGKQLGINRYGLSVIPKEYPIPVYYLPDEVFQKYGVHFIDNMENCSGVWPSSLTPEQIQEDAFVRYPLKVEVEIPVQQIRIGESDRLRIKVYASDQWGGARYFLNAPANLQERVAFFLDAPNFDFSPNNDAVLYYEKFPEKPAEQTWIIAPKERAAGEQSILINLVSESDTWAMSYDFDIKVRSLIGVSPALGASIVAAGGLITWLLATLNALRDIQLKEHIKALPKVIKKKHKLFRNI